MGNHFIASSARILSLKAEEATPALQIVERNKAKKIALIEATTSASKKIQRRANFDCTRGAIGDDNVASAGTQA
jgi:hypothetical protein